MNSIKKLEELVDQEKNEKMLEVHEIENTPFAVIEQNGEYFGALGNHRLTEIFDNLEDAKKETEEINWNRITQVIWAVTQKLTLTNKILDNE